MRCRSVLVVATMLLALIAVAARQSAYAKTGPSTPLPGGDEAPASEAASQPGSSGHWSSIAPSGAPVSADQQALPSGRLVSPLAITVGQCRYDQRSDWPHISNGTDASVHAWWTTSTPSRCPSTAKVTAYLQASWCDRFGCRWATVAIGRGTTTRPGGGAGYRDNARVRCANRTTPVAYRGGSDVDLTGVKDPAGITWGPPREGANALLCAPS